MTTTGNTGSGVRARFFVAPLGVLLVLLIASRSATAVEQAPRTTRQQVYTAAQAGRGEALYKELCLSCHPVETYTGNVFLTWQGRSLAELLEFLREKMPKNDPGSLTDEEYAEVIAYLLRLNAMPVGAAPLPAEVKALRLIRIDIAPKQP